MARERVIDALAEVYDPELDEPITRLGFVSWCEVSPEGEAVAATEAASAVSSWPAGDAPVHEPGLDAGLAEDALVPAEAPAAESGPAPEAGPTAEAGSAAEAGPTAQPWSAAEAGMLGEALTATFGSSGTTPEPATETGPAPIAAELDHPGSGHPEPGDSGTGAPEPSPPVLAADPTSATDSGDAGSPPADGDGYPANEGPATSDEEHPPF